MSKQINRVRRLLCLSILASITILLPSAAPSDQKSKLFVRQLRKQPGLVGLWDFRSFEGAVFTDLVSRHKLVPQNANIQQIEEGPLSGRSVELKGAGDYLSIAHSESGILDIATNQVTVIGWVKWQGGTGFVAGKWNEYTNGGKRQYGLFVSLPHYNGRDQVCGHISKKGGPTPPFPYSIDYSASKQIVPKDEWVCVAFTYDGTYIKSYVNGKFEAREPELIDHTSGFFPDKPEGIVQVKNPYHYPDGMGLNKSDFTVGGVQLKSGIGNFFKGHIGGVAVFNRALSETEMARWAVLPPGFQP